MFPYLYLILLSYSDIMFIRFLVRSFSIHMERGERFSSSTTHRRWSNEVILFYFERCILNSEIMLFHSYINASPGFHHGRIFMYPKYSFMLFYDIIFGIDKTLMIFYRNYSKKFWAICLQNWNVALNLLLSTYDYHKLLLKLTEKLAELKRSSVSASDG